jgi:hypothetical protein
MIGATGDCEMALRLRLTGLSPSPLDRDRKDYVVLSGGFVVGRIYEDRHAREELRGFRAINAVHAVPQFVLVWRTGFGKFVIL